MTCFHVWGQHVLWETHHFTSCHIQSSSSQVPWIDLGLKSSTPLINESCVFSVVPVMARLWGWRTKSSTCKGRWPARCCWGHMRCKWLKMLASGCRPMAFLNRPTPGKGWYCSLANAACWCVPEFHRIPASSMATFASGPNYAKLPLVFLFPYSPVMSRACLCVYIYICIYICVCVYVM